MKWLKRFFTKSEIREVSFYTGTDGMKKHSEFMELVKKVAHGVGYADGTIDEWFNQER